MQAHHAMALHVMRKTGRDSRYLGLLHVTGIVLAYGAGATILAILFEGLMKDLMMPIAFLLLFGAGVMGMLALVMTCWKLVRTIWSALVLLILGVPWNVTMPDDSTFAECFREELFDIWAT